MVFVKLRVSGDSGGKGEQTGRLPLAFLAVFEDGEEREEEARRGGKETTARHGRRSGTAMMHVCRMSLAFLLFL